MTFKTTVTKTVTEEVSYTPSLVYGEMGATAKERIRFFLAPGGRRIIGFRPPLPGDSYIAKNGAGIMICTEIWSPEFDRFGWAKGPRLIVSGPNDSSLDEYWE